MPRVASVTVLAMPASLIRCSCWVAGVFSVRTCSRSNWPQYWARNSSSRFPLKKKMSTARFAVTAAYAWLKILPSQRGRLEWRVKSSVGLKRLLEHPKKVGMIEDLVML
uniref:(northern house mosquito) hypothetical protein n=1 Tax=Culex pipiens TaxID=7175 RepID=A0A8D8EWG7_CULPI